MKVIGRLVRDAAWWQQNPHVALRVVLALAALIAMILGSGAGTDWN